MGYSGQEPRNKTRRMQVRRETAVVSLAAARRRLEEFRSEDKLLRLVRLISKMRAKALYKKSVEGHNKQAQRVRKLMAAVAMMSYNGRN